MGRTAAGKEEQDDWKPVGKTGKSFADVVKKREKQIPIKPEGLHAGHWRSTVVDLAEFISCVSTAEEEPLELGGLLVSDGISATLIALPTMKTSRPTQELSAPTLCSRGVMRVQKAVMLQWGTPAFPLAWKPTAVSSQVTAGGSVTLRVQVFFEVAHGSGAGTCPAQAA